MASKRSTKPERQPELRKAYLEADRNFAELSETYYRLNKIGASDQRIATAKAKMDRERKERDRLKSELTRLASETPSPPPPSVAATKLPIARDLPDVDELGGSWTTAESSFNEYFGQRLGQFQTAAKQAIQRYGLQFALNPSDQALVVSGEYAKEVAEAAIEYASSLLTRDAQAVNAAARRVGFALLGSKALDPMRIEADRTRIKVQELFGLADTFVGDVRDAVFYSIIAPHRSDNPEDYRSRTSIIRGPTQTARERRSRTCPTCKTPGALSELEARKGYQCKACTRREEVFG